MNAPSVLLRAIFGLGFVLLCQAAVLRAEDVPAGTAPAAFTVKVTGAGRPMIFIPGLSCGGDVWDAAVAHFKDRYQCHVLTLAGFAGQPSVQPPFLDQVRSGLIKYIRDNKLDHPVIIGHSLGGFMAYWVAETAPGQVGPVIAVDGLPFLSALFAPDATADSSRPFAVQIRTMYDTQTPAQFADMNRKALEGMITDPKNVDAVDATSKKSDPKAVGEAVYEVMTTDLRPDLKSIGSPVLLLGATAAIADPARRAAAEANYRRQVATIPRHQVVFAPRARHFIQLDEPQFFYAQVEAFLKPTGPAGAK